MITDALDMANLDIGTLALGDIAFDNTRVSPPAGVAEFIADIDLRPASDLIVKVEAGSELTWHLRSLDPATGEPPENPPGGFLPPNLQPPEGQGMVWFKCTTKPGLPTGTEIHNRTSIVFDENPAIATQDWVNTIDSTRPTSRVQQLEPTSTSIPRASRAPTPRAVSPF